MHKQNKYEAVSIPLRGMQPIKEEENQEEANTVSVNNEEMAELSDAVFAEIEIESKRTFFKPESEAISIEQREMDPQRHIFYEMRRRSLKNPFARGDGEIFYRQAKFMENFTDDYDKIIPLISYYPNYQNLTYEHLRTYFTWRTKVRNGVVEPISLSYGYLYIYELLLNIGVQDPQDGLNKLVGFWKTYREYESSVDRNVLQWFKDYHVYYQLPYSFEEFVYKHELKEYYPEISILKSDAQNSLSIWNSISAYDVTQSKFYNEGNEELVRECFYHVLSTYREACNSKNIQLEDFVYKLSVREMPWQPFEKSLFFSWLEQPNRQVILPVMGSYRCNNNLWLYKPYTLTESSRKFVGYIMKKTEFFLRQVVKYKYKITVNPSLIDRTLYLILNKYDILPDYIIQKAVTDYYRNLTRTVVTVDHENLARIRSEAQGTQEKLIVEESQGALEDLKNTPQAAASQATANEPREVDDVWGSFKNSLDAVEVEALRIIFQNKKSIKEFANEKSIMLEVLADGINEKAMDYIGDNILELDEDVILYKEYIKNIGKLLEE